MEPAEIEVQRLRITPQTSPLDSEVHLQMQFETPRHLRNCEWYVHYVVDTISRRKEVPLLRLQVEEYTPGRHQLELHVPRIELEGLKLKKSHILTTGLLALELQDASGPQLAVHMMTQVSESETGFVKTIINPLGQED